MEIINVESKKRCEIIDITEDIEEKIEGLEMRSGICVVYSPHTTGAILINENADPDVGEDICEKLKRLIPHMESFYKHFESNSDAHIKAALIGCSKSVIVESFKPILGNWGGIFFCEFDGPRKREIYLKVIPS